MVLSINFRSGTGYGLEFREALDYGPMGASEFNDVLGAGLYLQSRADVDPERIGLWGGLTEATTRRWGWPVHRTCLLPGWTFTVFTTEETG